jgi:DNA-directed RNA polymerase subunit beta'
MPVTTAGRVIFNEKVPNEAGYINEVLTKKALRDIIGDILKGDRMSLEQLPLDEIKDLGYGFAFRGGLIILLGDIMIPVEKQSMIDAK